MESRSGLSETSQSHAKYSRARPMPDLPNVPKPLLVCTCLLLGIGSICALICYFALVPYPVDEKLIHAWQWLTGTMYSVFGSRKFKYQRLLEASEDDQEQAGRKEQRDPALDLEERTQEHQQEFEWMLRRAQFEQALLPHAVNHRRRRSYSTGDHSLTAELRPRNYSRSRVTAGESSRRGQACPDRRDGSELADTKSTTQGVDGVLDWTASRIADFALRSSTTQQGLLLPVTQHDREAASEHLKAL